MTILLQEVHFRDFLLLLAKRRENDHKMSQSFAILVTKSFLSALEVSSDAPEGSIDPKEDFVLFPALFPRYYLSK